jgi:hypothetical protein
MPLFLLINVTFLGHLRGDIREINQNNGERREFIPGPRNAGTPEFKKVTIQFLEKLIMQFMSHSPVRCPSATSLRLIRS